MTLDETIVHEKELAEENYIQGMLCHANPDDGELDKCIECAKEHEQLAEWLRELQKYKDLKEQGRLVILPEGMNLRKLLDILTEYSPSCPCDYNLINRCELSCFECWLAALKGAENAFR